MNSLPAWIPAPRSWVNAIALFLLLAGFDYLVSSLYSYLWPFLLIIWNFLLEVAPWLLYTLVYVGVLLISIFPILLISFLHHWLHQFLDNFFPESKIPGEDEVKGLFPNLFSWWQGVYGWLVVNLSTTIAIYILAIFLPSTQLVNAEAPSVYALTAKIYNVFSTGISIPKLIIQIILAAYLYQLEFLIQQKLIVAGRRN
jgi:hypothetical protein